MILVAAHPTRDMKPSGKYASFRSLHALLYEDFATFLREIQQHYPVILLCRWKSLNLPRTDIDRDQGVLPVETL